jgi:hypothetical protein
VPRSENTEVRVERTYRNSYNEPEWTGEKYAKKWSLIRSRCQKYGAEESSSEPNAAENETTQQCVSHPCSMLWKIA